jgi:AraC family transcriptional regulator, transcriptional activator of pobA
MKEIKLFPYKNEQNKEIEIIEIGKRYKVSTLVSTPYRTDFYQIIWFKKGTVSVHIDFEEIPIEPDTILFLNKNKIQSYLATGKVEADIIIFTENFYNNSFSTTKRIERGLLFSDLLVNSIIKPSDPNFKIIKDIIFNEYFNQDDDFHLDFLRNQLHCFVLLAERVISKEHKLKSKGIDLDVYLQFKSLLDKKFKEEKSVAYYCCQLNITEKRLNRALTNVSSKTPKTEIHNKIILEAKWLLGNGELNITGISIELGFSEPTNFIKYFKKYTGKNPSAFSKLP